MVFDLKGEQYIADMNAEAEGKKKKKRDFLASYLESMPGGIYQNWLSKQAQPFQNYYGNSFNDFYNEYQGAMAKQTEEPTAAKTNNNSFIGHAIEQTPVNERSPLASTGELPTLSFADFLNSLDLNTRYGQLTSRQKGFYNPSAAPRTRFLSSY